MIASQLLLVLFMVNLNRIIQKPKNKKNRKIKEKQKSKLIVYSTKDEKLKYIDGPVRLVNLRTKKCLDGSKIILNLSKCKFDSTMQIFNLKKTDGADKFILTKLENRRTFFGENKWHFLEQSNSKSFEQIDQSITMIQSKDGMNGYSFMLPSGLFLTPKEYNKSGQLIGKPENFDTSQVFVLFSYN